MTIGHIIYLLRWRCPSAKSKKTSLTRKRTLSNRKLTVFIFTHYFWLLKLRCTIFFHLFSNSEFQNHFIFACSDKNYYSKTAKKALLKNFAKFTGKSLFNKIVGLKADFQGIWYHLAKVPRFSRNLYFLYRWKPY